MKKQIATFKLLDPFQNLTDINQQNNIFPICCKRVNLRDRVWNFKNYKILGKVTFFICNNYVTSLIS